MPNPYREIFRAKGTKGFATAGFLARLPVAMATISMVAMLSQTHGEYWLAGAVSATFGLTNAIVSPQISRLVDRYGQSRLLIPTTTLSVAAFAVLIIATHFAWPIWTLFVAALFAASMPSMPAMVRARWTELYRDTPKLNTAFAFESVADEVVYITGSTSAVGLSVALFPEAGSIASTIFLAVGNAAFILQRSTEPKILPAAKTGGKSPIGVRSVQILIFALMTIGVIFGTADVTVIALTKELGQPAAAGFVLGGSAIGTLMVGLVYGALKLKMPLSHQFGFAVAAIATTTVLLPFATSVPALAIAWSISSISISPILISAFGLIERLVPAAKLTEGITWAITGISIGAAIGSFASGWVIDQFGAANGFWVSVVAGGVALATVLFGTGSLATPDCRTAVSEAGAVPAE